MRYRCSMLGKLMTNPRVKSEKLSEICKTQLEILLKEELFCRKKEFSNKYTEKGIEAENQSIEMYSTFTSLELVKNDKRFVDNFLTGEPDAIILNTIYEFKTSWDLFTFPMFDKILPNNEYYWQVQGYMALTGCDKAEIIYCLTDTLENIIQDELRRFSWKNGFLDLPAEIEIEIRNNLTFSDIPIENRIKVFRVEKNVDDIEKLYARLKDCNDYLSELCESF